MDAPTLLYSPLLTRAGVPHAFSTRLGGVSHAPFDSLNFGNPGDIEQARRDPPGHIEANFARVLEALCVSGREVVQVHQIHASHVHVVRAGAPAHGAETTRADALVTDDPLRVIAVRVADCAPVLMASDDGSVVAAVHAGWRGVVAGIVATAADVMVSLGARRDGIVAAIGPCISGAELEIGSEVIAQFREAFGTDTLHVVETSGGKGYANMQGALHEQLLLAGIVRVDVLARCTVREKDLFFSHRRDKGLTGRMVGIIGAAQRALQPGSKRA